MRDKEQRKLEDQDIKDALLHQPEVKKKGPGRPRKVIKSPPVDALILRCSRMGCTMEEIADLLGEPESTVRGQYRGLYKKGRASWHKTIRRRQREILLSNRAGSTTLAVFLGKVELNQMETVRRELTGEGGGPLQIDQLMALDDKEFNKKAGLLGRNFQHLEGETG